MSSDALADLLARRMNAQAPTERPTRTPRPAKGRIATIPNLAPELIAQTFLVNLNEPGIYSISAESYHAGATVIPALSSSICKILCSSSPWHALTQHPQLNPGFTREDKDIFDRGTVAHALMLQGIEVATVLDYPDWKTKEAQQQRAALRQAGNIPILRKNWDRVKAMVEAGKRQIAAHKEASDAFTDGLPEQTVIWADDHGVQCKARLDWLTSNYLRIFDYKATGTSVNPESLSRFAVSQGWDIQSAFYRRGVKAVTGKDADFFFVAQEDFEPYAMTIVGMGPDFLWAGEQKVQAALETWAECLKTGKWPGYPDRVIYPSLPSYEETRIVEKQLREA